MTAYRCRSCGRTYGLAEGMWRCRCGGIFDLEGGPSLRSLEDAAGGPWSLWRYRHALPVVGSGERWAEITLGEGCTPVVSDRQGVLLKLDFLMPTRSFKDRGSAVLVAAAAGLGVRQLVADSSGNAGISIAAYAARAGIVPEVFVPRTTWPEKVAQFEAFGANVRQAGGTRAEAAAAAIARVEETGAFYASHVYNPIFHHGTKTFAFECCEQLGGVLPDALVLPAGNGTLLLGAARGFAELVAAGAAERMPRLYAVQAARCAPLAAARGMAVPDRGDTAAEGIAIDEPPRLAQMLAAVEASGAEVLIVGEDAIERARRRLLARGIDVEPTAAAAYAALEHGPADGAGVLLVALTGGGRRRSPASRAGPSRGLVD